MLYEPEIRRKIDKLTLKMDSLTKEGKDIEGHKRLKHYIQALKWVLDDEDCYEFVQEDLRHV